MAALRHIDDVAARYGDEGGDPGALRAERFLGYLHEYLLAFAQELLDGSRVAPVLGFGLDQRLIFAVVEVDRVLVCVGGNDAGILPAVRRVVSDVQEGVLLEADVHESGLHTGQDVGHDPLVDVADD